VRLTNASTILLSRQHLWRVAGTLAGGVALYGLVAPILAVVHETIVLATAALLSDLTWLISSSGLLRAVPFDPIYTGAMLLTIGGIEPRGLAITGVIGAWLHATWPGLFESPSLVPPPAFVSAIAEPGATVISRWLCGAMADVTLVALGLLAMRRGRRGRPWLVVVGAIVQAQVIVGHLVDSPPALGDVEAAGIPFAVAMIVSGDVQAGPRLAETLANLSEPARDVVLGLLLVALAYLPVGLALGARRLVRRPSLRWSLRPALTPSSLGRLLALGVLAVAIVLSPLGDLADAQTHVLVANIESDPATSDGAAIPLASSDPAIADPHSIPAAATTPTATATEAATPTLAPIPDQPAIVAVAGAHYQYQYTVNGVPQVIRGMGYNVRYRNLPPDERARRIDRDFAALHAAGVNTIFGWEPAEFDEVLLDSAYRHGLGVAPPFDLDPDADYADPAVRAELTRAVLAWVGRYQAHPAVRMWAIGNEVLHKLVYPSWMPIRSDPEWEQRARDFADFYVELIDKVHAVDPAHPIVHRDAEDAYVSWLRDAFARSPRRPWFIYGVNAYTPRLAAILASWPGQGWDVPLMVSEFAPGGMSPADRPEGFRSMWKMTRAASGWVIGGAAYAWTTDGPEEVDRVFGLVDADGNPVDGAFNAVGAMYRGGARQVATEPSSPSEARDERVWAFARQAILAVQAGHAADLLPVTADTSIMGDVNAVPSGPISDIDLTVERVRDPRRVSWAREAGVTGEWWVTWMPPAQPRHKLTLAVRQAADGTLSVQYIYRGPR
jgi:hypothetical protein